MATRNVVVDVFIKGQSNLREVADEGRRVARNLRDTYGRPFRTKIETDEPRPGRARIRRDDFLDETAAAARVEKSQQAMMWQLMGRENFGRAVRENLESDDGSQMHKMLQSLTYSARTEEAAARRQQIAVEMQRVGSTDHVRALREESALRRETVRMDKANRNAALVAEHGQSGAFLRRIEETLAGPGRFGRNVAMGGIGMIAGLAASSPSLSATLGGSMQLMTGSIARIFLPQIMTMASMAQRAAVRLNELDDSTRRGIGTTAAWTIGIGAAAYGASLLTRSVRRVSDMWRAAGSLGAASALAPMTGIRGGFVGRVAGRAMQGGGLALGGFAAGEIAEAFGAPSEVGSGLTGAGFAAGAGSLFGAGRGTLGRLGIAGFTVGALMGRFQSSQVAGQQAAQVANAGNIGADLRTALEPLAGADITGGVHRDRFHAIRAIMARHRLTPEMIGMNRFENAGVDPRIGSGVFGIGGAMTRENIESIATDAAHAAEIRRMALERDRGTNANILDQVRERMRGETGVTLERSQISARVLEAVIQQQQQGPPAGQGAAGAGGGGFTPDLRHFMAFDTNFQSRQIDVADLHNIVQAEAVRTPLQQALFAQDMRILQDMMEWMNRVGDGVQPFLERLITAVEQNPAGAAP